MLMYIRITSSTHTLIGLSLYKVVDSISLITISLTLILILTKYFVPSECARSYSCGAVRRPGGDGAAAGFHPHSGTADIQRAASHRYIGPQDNLLFDIRLWGESGSN